MPVTNYQCPACTGPVHFSEKTGKVECDYCGSSYDIAEIENLYAEGQPQPAPEPPAGDDQWPGEGMQAFSCPSCGAEMIYEDTVLSLSCPYCGNNAVVHSQLTGVQKPDLVIPFKLDKDAAVEALKGHYKGKLLLPGAFKKTNQIEKIQGVYVPFWLFGGRVDADVTYKAQESSSVRHGDKIHTTKKHYQVRRVGHMSFDRVPVDGSTRMPDTHMDAIEPFDYSEMVPFSPAYLPGYMANKYDVPAGESRSRADARIRTSTMDSMRATVTSYDSAVVADQHLRVKFGDPRYALLPVWLLNTKYKDKDYLFAMNGQTGRLVGNLPVSVLRLLLLIALVAIPLFLLIGEPIITTVVTAVVAFWQVSVLKTAQKKSNAAEYVVQGLSITAREDRYTHTTHSVTHVPSQNQQKPR